MSSNITRLIIFLIATSCIVGCQCSSTGDDAVEPDKVIDSPKTQLEIDMRSIQKYLTKKNIETEVTPSGVFYLIEQQGEGATVKAGNKVQFHTIARYLNGAQFYSSYEAGQPIEVVIGQKMVIPGIEEGLQLLKDGGKATLYIPSPLAYASEGSGAQVPPNAIVIHEIEVVSVR